MFRAAGRREESRVATLLLRQLRTGKRLLFPFAKRFPIASVDLKISFCTVEQVAYLDTAPAFCVSIQATGFKLQDFSIFIFENRALGVRCFLRTFIRPPSINTTC